MRLTPGSRPSALIPGLRERVSATRSRVWAADRAGPPVSARWLGWLVSWAKNGGLGPGLGKFPYFFIIFCCFQFQVLISNFKSVFKLSNQTNAANKNIPA